MDAIGHPTGRLIGKRKPYALNLDEVLKAAADYDCMLELNRQPSRLDLDEISLAVAKERRVIIVLGTAPIRPMNCGSWNMVSIKSAAQD